MLASIVDRFKGDNSLNFFLMYNLTIGLDISKSKVDHQKNSEQHVTSKPINRLTQ